MVRREWIEFFFSKSFENDINMLILDDYDYVPPYDRIVNYIENIVSIPYSEFIEYVKSQNNKYTLTKDDLPEIEENNYSSSELIWFLLKENNRGVTAEEIANELEGGWNLFYHAGAKTAKKYIRTYSILGLTYEYYNQIYLNCLVLVFERLSRQTKSELLARLVLRSPLYAYILPYLWKKSETSFISDALPAFTPELLARRIKAIKCILDICRNCAQKEYANIGLFYEEFNSLKYQRKARRYSTRNRIYSIRDYFADPELYAITSSTDKYISYCFGSVINSDLSLLNSLYEETEEEAFYNIIRDLTSDKLLMENYDDSWSFNAYSNWSNRRDMIYYDETLDEDKTLRGPRKAQRKCNVKELAVEPVKELKKDSKSRRKKSRIKQDISSRNVITSRQKKEKGKTKESVENLKESVICAPDEFLISDLSIHYLYHMDAIDLDIFNYLKIREIKNLEQIKKLYDENSNFLNDLDCGKRLALIQLISQINNRKIKKSFVIKKASDYPIQETKNIVLDDNINANREKVENKSFQTNKDYPSNHEKRGSEEIEKIKRLYVCGYSVEEISCKICKPERSVIFLLKEAFRDNWSAIDSELDK